VWRTGCNDDAENGPNPYDKLPATASIERGKL
jgi:hypothetical protein